MKRKTANGFRKRYCEQYIDYDIINEFNGYRCIEVFVKGGSKYNLLNRQGYTISDVWYDEEIMMSKSSGVFHAEVVLNGKRNLIDEHGVLFFPDIWFTDFYGSNRCTGEDGRKYEYDLKTRELREFREDYTCSYSGGYGMRNGYGNWF